MKQTPPHSSPQSARNAALVIFAKAPIAGQVKTRLCPPLTHDEAATLHGSFVLDMLERTKAGAAKLKLPIDRYLACAPSSTLVFFQIMEERQSVKLIDQVGDDLGARMQQAFAALFEKGYQRVFIVGTDIPSLPLDHYQQALALLNTHDVVLGPAMDGGYYLIGLKQPRPELFANIAWSTDRVLAATQEKAASLGLTTALLSPWRDVDTIDDLRALIEASAADAKKPKNEQAFSQRTAGALQHLAKCLRTRASDHPSSNGYPA
ncbi:MAG: TIGR04282 family arsenosugar biosynthesis glycosyltransferase [Nitrospira sp.]|nr:TIGR04282 family arsenosugar biosynthesis glycosyltransferase [Nitrospira sp.]